MAVAGSYAYVADEDAGLRIIDVSDPAAPFETGFYDTPGYAEGVAVSGSYAYVADSDYGGLVSIDISDPTAPFEAGVYTTPGGARGVAVSGSYAYVAADQYGLPIIDVSDPAAPFEAGSYDTPGFALGVAVSGNYAYVADYYSLRIIDVSDPSAPFEAGSFDTPGYAVGVAVAGSYAYVADSYSLRIIDVSDPAAPFQAGSTGTPGYVVEVAVSGSYAYVAADYGGLRIIDVSDPSAPFEAGFYYTPGSACGVAVAGSYAYVADFYSLRVIEVSDPSAPFEVGFYDTPGSAIGVAVAGSYAYMANYNDGLLILHFSAVPPSNLNVSGPSQGVIDEPYTFTAVVDPISTTLPITTVWRASQQSPITYTVGITNSATYSWPMSGPQNITVTAVNFLRQVVTATHSITLFNSNTADFTGVPVQGVAPLQVAFTNTSTGDFDTCEWSFGNGGGSEFCANTYTNYSIPGNFTITLSISGRGGSDTEVKQDYISVYRQVVAGFEASPRVGIAPLEVAFTNTSTGDYTTSLWDFGDGTASTEPDAIHTYTNHGAYTVTLTVSGPGGTDEQVMVDFIDVYEPVQADFSASPTEGFSPLSVSFNNLSSGDYQSCEWVFGDGTTSTSCFDQEHLYNTPGAYTVTLTIDGLGGTDIETKESLIRVIDYSTQDYKLYLPAVNNQNVWQASPAYSNSPRLNVGHK